METTWVRLPDGALDVGVAGPAGGPVVLLLHGFPQDRHEWADVAAALAADGRRVVAPDQRGVSPGLRPDGDDGYAMAHLVADAVALLDALGVAAADVVGHDWGAAVGWQLAARHADRVRSLVAVSVPHPDALSAALARDADQQRRSAYIRFFREHPDPTAHLLADDAAGLRRFFVGAERVDVDRYARAALADPGRLRAGVGWYRAMRAEDYQGVGAVAAPVLHVWSDEDPALGRLATDLTAEHVEGPYRLEVLAGRGHWLPEDAADDVVRLVREHLRGTSPVPGHDDGSPGRVTGS